MFREPLPKKSILCQSDISEINGKLRSLRKLKRHPNASEMKTCLDQLGETLRWVLACAHFPCTKESQASVNMGLRRIAEIENFVIRVIVQGKSCEVALAEVRQQFA